MWFLRRQLQTLTTVVVDASKYATAIGGGLHEEKHCSCYTALLDTDMTLEQVTVLPLTNEALGVRGMADREEIMRSARSAFDQMHKDGERNLLLRISSARRPNNAIDYDSTSFLDAFDSGTEEHIKRSERATAKTSSSND